MQSNQAGVNRVMRHRMYRVIVLVALLLTGCSAKTESTLKSGLPALFGTWRSVQSGRIVVFEKNGELHFLDRRENRLSDEPTGSWNLLDEGRIELVRISGTSRTAKTALFSFQGDDLILRREEDPDLAERHELLWAKNTAGYVPIPNTEETVGALDASVQSPHDNSNENAVLSEAWDLVLKEKNYAKGERLAKKALSQDPKLIEAYSLLNVCLMASGRNTDRVTLLKKGLTCCPESGHLWFLLGQSYASLQQRDSALRAYSEALKHDLQELDSVHFNMGNMYFDLEKFEEARRRYENCLYINPGHLKAMHQLVGTCAMLGDVESAKNYANLLIKRDADGKEGTFAKEALKMIEN